VRCSNALFNAFLFLFFLLLAFLLLLLFDCDCMLDFVTITQRFLCRSLRSASFFALPLAFFATFAPCEAQQKTQQKKMQQKKTQKLQHNAQEDLFMKIRLPDEFSKHQPTILPILTSDGKRLYFDRKNYVEDTGGVYDYDDIWYSDLLPDGSWSKARNIGAPLNTEGSDVLCSLSPDDRSAIVYGVYDRELPVKTEGFSITRYKDGKWLFPEPILIRNFYNRAKKYYARLAPDNRTLLLALERDDALGGLDLYVSFREDSSLVWTEPLNLGATVNTSRYEGSPHLSADGRTLYFSSEGHPGNGVADLFMTRRLDETWQRWSKPVNLGERINSRDEDSSIDVSLDGSTAYFLSSDSNGVKGLYKATLSDSLRHEGALLLSGRVAVDKRLTKQNDIADNARVFLTAYQTLGFGASAKTVPVAFAEASLDEPQYAMALPLGGVYALEARIIDAPSIPSWLGVLDLRRQTENPAEKERFERRRQNVVFSPAEGRAFTLPEIRFAQGQADIAAEYDTDIAFIAFVHHKLQMEFPAKQVVVELSGSTCDIGSAQTNAELSLARAEAVSTALRSKGTPPECLEIRSDGEIKDPIASRLKSQERIEEERAQRRRVKVRITLRDRALKRAQW
jgi:outer membrane protein OmpA-like peptidoglycan-associated protein